LAALNENEVQLISKINSKSSLFQFEWALLASGFTYEIPYTTAQAIMIDYANLYLDSCGLRFDNIKITDSLNSMYKIDIDPTFRGLYKIPDFKWFDENIDNIGRDELLFLLTFKDSKYDYGSNGFFVERLLSNSINDYSDVKNSTKTLVNNENHTIQYELLLKIFDKASDDNYILKPLIDATDIHVSKYIYNCIQVALFNKMIRVSEYGKYIEQIFKIANPDKKNVQHSVLDIELIYKDITKLNSYEYIANAHRLIGDDYKDIALVNSDKSKDAFTLPCESETKIAIKPQTPGSIVDFHECDLLNKIWEQTYILNLSTLDVIINNLTSVSGFIFDKTVSISEQVDKYNKIQRALRSYIYTHRSAGFYNNADDLKTIRYQILIDENVAVNSLLTKFEFEQSTVSITNVGDESLQTDSVIFNTSFASIVNILKTTPLGQTNAFIHQSTFPLNHDSGIQYKVRPSIIGLLTLQKDLSSEIVLIECLADMLIGKSSNTILGYTTEKYSNQVRNCGRVFSFQMTNEESIVYTLRDLAIELIQFQFLINNHSRFDITQYIPPQIYNALSTKKFLQNFNNKDFLWSILNNDLSKKLKYNLTPFIVQFIQHNPWYVASSIAYNEIEYATDTNMNRQSPYSMIEELAIIKLNFNGSRRLKMEKYQVDNNQSNRVELPIFIKVSIKDTGRKGLYILQDSNSYVYLKIPLYGDSHIKEYNANNDLFYHSLIQSNNTGCLQQDYLLKAMMIQ